MPNRGEFSDVDIDWGAAIGCYVEVVGNQAISVRIFGLVDLELNRPGCIGLVCPTRPVHAICAAHGYNGNIWQSCHRFDAEHRQNTNSDSDDGNHRERDS